MARVVLQMVSVGTLLIVIAWSSSCLSAASRSVRCVSKDELKNRIDRYERYWRRTSISKIHAPPRVARSCAQVAKAMYGDVNGRALSPWSYYYNYTADRFPYKISYAECLCHGCIIGQQEKLAYNSVPVFSDLKVLVKNECPFDSNQFVLKKSYIKIPVACTCVVPKYTK